METFVTITNVKSRLHLTRKNNMNKTMKVDNCSIEATMKQDFNLNKI